MKKSKHDDKARFAWVARGIAGWTILQAMMGCGAETPEAAGGGGASNGVGGTGSDAVAEELEVVDHRWDAPEGLESILPPATNAVACSMNSQCATGYCVDGFCCDTKCDNKCMACSAAKKGSGADGVCGSIKYDTDPDNDCPSGACDGKNMCKNYNGFACTASAQCLSNYCVDGICCGNICMGACQACSAAKKGGGADGVCGNIAVNTDPDNECTGSACNGTGACQTAQTPAPNGTACTSAAQCQSGYCADGVCCDSWCLGTCQACTAVKKGSGSDGTCGPIANDKDPDEECWGGACNGQAVCKQYNGVPCSDKSQCLSNYCVDGVCCGNICTGMCQACSEAKKGQGYDGVCGPIAAGKDVEDECNPGECNGSGACNQPQTPQANGTACVSAGQCASSNCVDGVCCDTTCTGTCQACSAAKKGSGADGTCGAIASESDPDKECGGGRCDGKGACRYYNGATCSSATQCFSNYCVDGVCCGNVCAGPCQACTAAKKGGGYDGGCGAIASGSDPEGECTPGECNGAGACNQTQSTQPNGAACTFATQCASGYCIDGVCCDNVCVGTCKACSAAKKGQGTDGTCDFIANGVDPENECTNGECNGAGTCVMSSNQPNGVGCAGASQCASGHCVDGVCCDTACTGSCVACSATKKGQGSDGTCGNIKYDTDPDEECYGGGCSGTGACAYYNGVGCSANAECLSKYCVDGFCCNNVCSGTCRGCSAAKKGSGYDGVCGLIAANTDPDEECPAGVCNAAGVCIALVPNGNACSGNSECASGFCADGVCCNSACSGLCEACTATKKGSGVDGVCGFIATGSDPDTECGMTTCDGSGACLPLGDGAPCTLDTHCASGHCVDGVCCDTGCSEWCKACNVAGLEGICSETSPGACLWCPGEFGLPEPPVAWVAVGAHAAVAADFNGDGKLDIATANRTGSTVSVVLTGSGGFLIGTSHYTAGTYPYSIVSADFNADGKPDIAVTNNGSNNISVLLNKGDGTFHPKVDYATGLKPRGLVAADFNGDGKADFANADYDNSTFTVWFNLGNGTFGGKAGYQIGNLYPEWIAAGDFDADGKMDLAVTHVNGGVVYRNQGAGTFSGWWSNFSPFSNNQLVGLVAADLNNDGKADLATVGAAKYVQWWLSNGSGLNGPAGQSVNYAPNMLAAVDIHGDGKKDLITGGDGALNELRNIGNGNFDTAVNHFFHQSASSTLIADMNVDGKLDVVAISSSPGTAVVKLNQAAATFSFLESGYSLSMGTYPRHVRMADLNGDGFSDLAIVNSSNSTLELRFNNGNETFSIGPSYSMGSGTAQVVSADLDGDGDIDLATANDTANTVTIRYNDGNGSFNSLVTLAAGNHPRSVAAGDFNGDGHLDLAVANQWSSKMGVLINQPGVGFAPLVEHVVDSSPVLVAAGDLNGDGRTDVACATGSSINVMLNNGNGTFTTTLISTSGDAETNRSITLTDVNADGALDLALARGQYTSILLNAGNGAFGPKVNYANGGSAQDIAAADMNGDGKIDLATSGETSKEVSVLLNNGNGTFASPPRRYTGSGVSLAAGDLNGDSRPDIAVSGGKVLFHTCL